MNQQVATIMDGMELKEDDIRDRVEQLKLMIKSDSDINPIMRQDEVYLLRYLHFSDFNIEQAHLKFKKFYQLLTNNIKWFGYATPKAHEDQLVKKMRMLLDTRDKDGRLIIVAKMANTNTSQSTINDVFQVDDILLELGWDDPITLRKGFCSIVDVKDMSFKLMVWATPKNIIFAVKKLDAIPLKDLKVHIVNKSRYLDASLALFWPFVPAKLKKNFSRTEAESILQKKCLLAIFFETVYNLTILTMITHKSVDQSTIIQPLEEFSHEKWMEIAREELKETPEKRKQELATLKRLLNSDSNLIVPNEDEFLLRFLRARKFDSKKAFNMLQRYYLMKLKCPQLFHCSLPSQGANVFQLQAQTVLDDRDQFGRRVYVIRVDNFDSSKVTINEIFRTNIMALEHAVREFETQIAGLSVLLDMHGLSLNHAKFFTPYYAKKMVELVQETFPLRFKGFHVVNEPFYFDAIMTVLKPFLKEKIRKRIYLHGSDLNSLHAFLSPQILPKEYGGKLGAFDNRSWQLELLKNEEYFINIRKFGYVNTSPEETVDTDDDLLK